MQHGEHLPGWVAEFERRHGRPPRVLHIGNIANNAYNNVKLLERIGIRGDVLCAGYYHIMGCPEWEDADFETGYRDQFNPDWGSVDLKGFERPAWFAQGSIGTCVEYLVARREGRRLRSWFYWRYMQFERAILAGSLSRSWARRVPAMMQRIRLLVSRVSGRILPHANPPSMVRRDVFRELAEYFRRRFPEREDALTVEELTPFGFQAEAIGRLIRHYDLVQAYAADPIFAAISDTRPFVAFEHGTLRELPFQDSTLGRITAVGYALADHILVTNFDCMENAQALLPGHCTFINHPYHEDHHREAGNWRELRSRLQQEYDAKMVFFFPTRHDWVPGEGFADKGNDVFLRAFATFRRIAEPRAMLICCNWGHNVSDSRKLIHKTGISGAVKWTDPLPGLAFDRYCLAADYVVDQFVLGSFGGVTFKAMATGRPVISYLDQRLVQDFYSEPPPIISCRTESEIVDKLVHLSRTATRWTERCSRSRRWIETCHSGVEVATKQAAVYRDLIDGGRWNRGQTT